MKESSIQTLEIVKEEYSSLIPRYKRLSEIIKLQLQEEIERKNLPIFDIQTRVKTLESFEKKIRRKGYTHPLEQIEDLCGIRIICIYPNDLEELCNIVQENLDATEQQDKAQDLGVDRLGYRSIHYNAKMKHSDCSKSDKHLSNYKAEVQVRTIAMHAWAEISHRLSYKSENQIPTKFLRKIHLLSGLFELADNTFEILINEREEYVKELKINFNLGLKPDLENLPIFLELYFPKSSKDSFNTEKLLNELIRFDISYRSVVELYEQFGCYLDEVANEIDNYTPLTRVGIVRVLLDLCNESFWTYHKEQLPIYSDSANRIMVIEKWQKKLNCKIC